MIQLIQIITGGLGALGFALLFNIRGKKLVAAAIGGFLSWGIFLGLGLIMPGEPIRYFLVSAIISLYSEIMARWLRTPTTTFIITALIPLIPGGSLYYTMSAALGGDMADAVTRGLYTLELATALALGIVLVSALFRVKKGTRQ